jgi:hypothetical protein
MGKLDAEEGLMWLARLHPGENLEKLYKQLRKAAGYVMDRITNRSLVPFLTNPLLSRNVIRKGE